METELLAPPVILPPARAEVTDARLLELWLHDRPQKTRTEYRRDVLKLLDFTAPMFIRQITLSDLQNFSDSLKGLKPSSRARTLSAAKSLFRFAHEIGYIPLNPAIPLRLPKTDGCQSAINAKRILSEAEIKSIIAAAETPRDHVILSFLYYTGCRASELLNLRNEDLQERSSGGQATLRGKGDKTRAVLLPTPLWTELAAFRNVEQPTSRLFAGVRGGSEQPLNLSTLFRIVRKAAVAAGITKGVSPHWLRHGHASHALDRGAPIHLVRDTLGHASISTSSRYAHARPNQCSSTYLETV